MGKMLGKVPGLLTALVGLLIILTPHGIAPVCAGNLELKSGMFVHMKCFWTGQAEIVLGALILLTGLLMIVARSAETVKFLGVVSSLLAIAVFLVPNEFVIGICGKDMMDCHKTAFFLNIWSALGLVAGITAFVLSKSRYEGSSSSF